MVDVIQRDVFISHEKGDGDVALELAARLRSHGFTTWCYEEDSTAGSSYLVQIDRAIEAARSVVVIVSTRSLRSPHVRNEVVRAYEGQKQFIPIRRDVPHEALLNAQDQEDDERRREWRMAFGASVSIAWDYREPEKVVERVIEGLRRFGVEPGGSQEPYAPRRHSTGNGADGRDRYAIGIDIDKHKAGLGRVLRASWTRILVAAIVATLGLLFNSKSLVRVFTDPTQAYFYRVVPPARWLNLAANALGLWLNISILRSLVRIGGGDWSQERAIVRDVSRQLLVVFAWTIASLATGMSYLGDSYGNLKSGYIGSVILAGILAGLQLGFVRWLFTLEDRRS